MNVLVILIVCYRYCYAVLSCLPWVGRKLNQKRKLPLEMLLTTIEVYMNKRSCEVCDALLDLPNEYHIHEEYLERLWNQINKLEHDSWSEDIILRPHLIFQRDLCTAIQHKLPEIMLPPHHDARVYPMPWVVYRIFCYSDGDEVSHQ